MNNDKEQLKLYATKVLEFVDIVKDLFQRKVFEDEGVISICFLRYNTSNGAEKKIRLMLDFYDKDGLMMSQNEGFKEIPEIRKMVQIISYVNTLPQVYSEIGFAEDVMLTIDTVKYCDQVVLETLLPKPLQIQVEYNELDSEIKNNAVTKQNKIKI